MIERTTIKEFRKNLRKLERRLAVLLEGDTVCCGVTMAQCHVLLAIEEKEHTTVTELASELELDKSTLSRTVDGLLAAGFVSRETNAENRRSQHITLTPEGARVTTVINGQWEGYFKNLFSLIPEEKLLNLVEGVAILSTVIPASGCCGAGVSAGAGIVELKDNFEKKVGDHEYE
jgi:DNA-binding MarR family transcriptional regulator